VLSPAHKEKVGRFLTAGELRLLVLAALTISGMIIISTQINAPPWLHSIALFGHLVSLLIGFGSVLTVDWYGLLFLFRVLPMRTVLLQAHRVTPLIWLGLLGLTVTGGLLEPDLESPLVVLKLCAVFGVALVGVLALGSKRAMLRLDPVLPRSLILRGMVLTAASQSFWWTALVIGFITHQSRH